MGMSTCIGDEGEGYHDLTHSARNASRESVSNAVAGAVQNKQVLNGFEAYEMFEVYTTACRSTLQCCLLWHPTVLPMEHAAVLPTVTPTI